MQDRESNVQTSLQAIAEKAANQPGYRFRNLYGMLNERMLKDSWKLIRKDAAFGVDRVSANDYEQNLDENIHQLVEGLKQKRYRAKLVRRRYIPKGNGKLRPLGIPTTQDKLLQLGVKRILEAIYEQDFLKCSYGYRPNIGPLDAVARLTANLQFGKYNYVVEADIKGFFDNIDHEWLLNIAVADNEVVESRDTGHRWESFAPGNGNTSRWHNFTNSCECVPALCFRFVVSESSNPALQWQGEPDPICGRLCVCF